MNNSRWLHLPTAALIPGLTAAIAQPQTVSPRLAETSPPRIVTASAHERTAESVSRWTAADGQVSVHTNRWVELASGLNRFDEATQNWVPATAQWESTPEGHVVARQTAHRVILAPNLNVAGAVDVLTPDAVRLRATPLALAYHDAQSDRAVILAEVRDSTPILVSDNEVLYPGAFDGAAVDVRFRLALDRFEQDVIIRERLADPVVFGLEPASTRLVVITEFHEAPAPATTASAVGDGEDGDETWLGFGQMALGPGRAFSMGSENAEGTDWRVSKSWQVMDGRSLLFEAVELAAVKSVLDALPAAEQASVGRSASDRLASTGWRLPPRRHLRTAAVEPGKTELVSPVRAIASVAAATPTPGLVLDYVLLSTSLSGYTLKGDTTYLVTGTVNLSGTTSIEGGTVVKFEKGANASLQVWGDLDCRTDLYRPAIFTAKDDDTVGEVIGGSTGTPSGEYALYALYHFGPAATLQNLRFKHATYAMRFDAVAAHTLRHAQFVHCKYPVYAWGGSLSLQNLLLHEAFGRALRTVSGTIAAEHLTVHGAHYFFGGGSLTLTNSLLVAVTNWGTAYTGPGNVIAVSADGLFEPRAGGAHYLAAASPHRNTGVPAIGAALVKDFASMTTWPPAEHYGEITTDTTWGPLADRDTDIPDLGYHYPALDYLTSETIVSGATLTLTNGVSVGVWGSSGFKLQAAAYLLSSGTPLALNRLVRYPAVQEQTDLSYPTPGTGTFLAVARNCSQQEKLRTL